MNKRVESKLAKLPAEPGVYLYKNSKGKIIYVGKAAVLRNRVRQYFHLSRTKDTKTDQLVANIADLDWLTVGSEMEALFLESELIKRYKPKYNIELRDDKHYEYVRIDLKSDHPTVQITRRPLDDGATYCGPYVQGIRQALRLLRRVFPYDTARPLPSKRPSLHQHIGLSPGLEHGLTTVAQYRSNLRKLIKYLNGKHATLERDLERDMKKAAAAQEFERAARLRNQMLALKRLGSQVVFGEAELFDITKDQALDGLQKLIEVSSHLRRIEGYDISHLSGTNNVASMVVFTDGVADKREYRKFRMRLSGNNDFAHMREVISRRFSGRNLEQWPKPDLLLIDGGKGQVSAAIDALTDLGIYLPVIGLAKRLEQIIMPRWNLESGVTNLEVMELGLSSPITKLLQRVRDESHRFAVSYQTVLRSKDSKKSWLDELPGVGPKTRKQLLKKFGSLKKLAAVSEKDLVELLGPKRGALVAKQIRSLAK